MLGQVVGLKGCDLAGLELCKLQHEPEIVTQALSWPEQFGQRFFEVETV